MPERNNNARKKVSIEWILRGVLTKIGDTFDRLTGRSYKPSSSLATTEIIEKLKKILDLEVRNGKFVPHNIQLKMQWDKFSTDSDEALKKLEDELKIAVIDHINDNRYHTYAPVKLQIKPDYFTEGIKLSVSFEKFAEEKGEIAINLPVPQIETDNFVQSPPEIPPPQNTETFIVRFTIQGKARELKLTFERNQKLSVGRSKENDLCLEDPSVSKIHGSLVMNSEKQLLVADTGSTNGTFINDERIAYGRAFPIKTGADRVKFGNVEVKFEHLPKPEETSPELTVPINPTDARTIAVNQKDLTVEFSNTQQERLTKLSQENSIMEKKLRGESSASTLSQSADIEFLKKTSSPKLKENLSEQTETQEKIFFDFSKDE